MGWCCDLFHESSQALVPHQTIVKIELTICIYLWMSTHVVISQTHRIVSQEWLSPGAGTSVFIYPFQSYHLVSSGSNIWGWCVTPHSFPTRGCWCSTTIFNIVNIFTIINQIENGWKIAQYHYFAGFTLHPSPLTRLTHDHVTWFVLLFQYKDGGCCNSCDHQPRNWAFIFLKTKYCMQNLWGGRTQGLRLTLRSLPQSSLTSTWGPPPMGILTILFISLRIPSEVSFMVLSSCHPTTGASGALFPPG